MEKIFLSLFLLTSTIYSMEVPKLEEQESSRKARASHRFLVGVKELAYSIGLSKPLHAIEGSLSNLSESYKYNNLLANVKFTACVLAPELRERSDIISVRLSRKDMNVLHHELFLIRNCVMEIAENQNLEHFAPLMIRELHLSDGALSVASRAMGAVENCKVNIMLRTFTAAAQVFDRELAHDIKNEILTDMLRNFERMGGLVSLINVDFFKREDIYRMEEISEALNTLEPLFKKANAK